MAVRVQLQDFDAAAEVRALVSGRPEVGSVVTFTGFVRGEEGGRQLQTLTLEHYPGMTEGELEHIEGEARHRFELTDSLIVHRYGELRPGDAIVLVVAASRHRRAAFEAAEFLMDYLKTRAPFWKKEIYSDGAENWVDAREGDGKAMDRWGTAPSHKKSNCDNQP